MVCDTENLDVNVPGLGTVELMVSSLSLDPRFLLDDPDFLEDSWVDLVPLCRGQFTYEVKEKNTTLPKDCGGRAGQKHNHKTYE